MSRPFVVDGVPDEPTAASVKAAIDACNAERARANALVPGLDLPYESYPVWVVRAAYYSGDRALWPTELMAR